MDSKAFWLSKTFWVNILAAVALLVQSVWTGFVIPPEWQAMALTAINFVLRLITKQPVAWS